MIRQEIDSPYAWLRLALTMIMATIGGVGLWSVVVAFPAVQADFNAARSEASLPFTCASVGIAIGSVVMGRLVDKAGLIRPLLIGAVSLGSGYVAASLTGNIWLFSAVYLFIGMFGSAATFVPLVSDITFWFEKRRGLAVSIFTSGNYLAGAIWPPVVEYLTRTHGWRQAHWMIGIFCLLTMPAMAMLLRSRSPRRAAGAPPIPVVNRKIALPPGALQALLSVAGLACCVAMAMPQVHIVAYCGDLRYSAADGARMLSLMLGFGIISRIGSGFLADKVGGVMTLLIGSIAQMVALALYLMMDGLTALYVISALFGLFQGGLIPSYAIIVRENYPPRETGSRVGVILMMTLLGMGLGGWMSGVIYDRTGSYEAAFANGVAWNAVHVVITLFLLLRSANARRTATARPAASAAE